MAALAKQLGAKRTEVIATSAVRGAANSQRFLDLVREETGLRIKIVDGEDEAALSFRSALAHFDLGVGRAAIIDIGGGSLELALSADGLLERLLSLRLGAIRMTEEFLSDGKRKGLTRLRKYARRKLEKNLPISDWRGSRVICSEEPQRTSPEFFSLAEEWKARAQFTAPSCRGLSSSTSLIFCTTCRRASDRALPV